MFGELIGFFILQRSRPPLHRVPPSLLYNASPPDLKIFKMFSTFFSIALIIAPALQGVLADFAVNTPSINQVCFSAPPGLSMFTSSR